MQELVDNVTNSDAKDARTISPSDLPDHLCRRFHIELNHRDSRETVVIE